MMPGDVAPAAEARCLGVVNRLAAPDAVPATALALAERPAAGPRRALGLIKQMVGRYEHDLAGGGAGARGLLPGCSETVIT